MNNKELRMKKIFYTYNLVINYIYAKHTVNIQ